MERLLTFTCPSFFFLYVFRCIICCFYTYCGRHTSFFLAKMDPGTPGLPNDRRLHTNDGQVLHRDYARSKARATETCPYAWQRPDTTLSTLALPRTPPSTDRSQESETCSPALQLPDAQLLPSRTHARYTHAHIRSAVVCRPVSWCTLYEDDHFHIFFLRAHLHDCCHAPVYFGTAPLHSFFRGLSWCFSWLFYPSVSKYPRCFLGDSGPLHDPQWTET